MNYQEDKPSIAGIGAKPNRLSNAAKSMIPQITDAFNSVAPFFIGGGNAPVLTGGGTKINARPGDIALTGNKAVDDQNYLRRVHGQDPLTPEEIAKLTPNTGMNGPNGPLTPQERVDLQRGQNNFAGGKPRK